jgi:hypothetical protein
MMRNSICYLSPAQILVLAYFVSEMTLDLHELKNKAVQFLKLKINL